MDHHINENLNRILQHVKGAPGAPAAPAPVVEAKNRNAPPAEEMLTNYLSDLIQTVCAKLQCEDEADENTAVDLVLAVIADQMEGPGGLGEIPDTDTASPEEITLWITTAQQLQIASLVTQAADEILDEMTREDGEEWDAEEWE
jgi:hypothetical protein